MSHHMSFGSDVGHQLTQMNIDCGGHVYLIALVSNV